MKSAFVLIFVFIVISKSSIVRRKGSNNEDDFIRTSSPSNTNNKGNTNNRPETNEESFVRTETPTRSKPVLNKPNSNNDDEEEPFVKENLPDPNSKKDDGTVSSNAGTFWHISDLHLDFYYNQNASNPKRVCPSSNGADPINPGPYGDYRCDSPWKLINSSIYAMRSINAQPEFIIWTGDATMHTNDEEKYLGKEKVLESIKNITDLFRTVFPDVEIIPALGNHDWHPKNQMPTGSNDFLSDIADLWGPWLGPVEREIFADGGFYTLNPPKVPNLMVVVLNTNIWYSSNKQINHTFDQDPGGEFEYLRSVLNQAVENEMKVYIVGHIPPGYFELVDYKYWLYPIYNKQYIELVQEYHNVIAGQFFGHHHTDTFRIFNYNGQSVSTAWIAPGVSPWMTTLPGVENGANNPGIRLFQFDKVSLMPTDYHQYYLDLQKANSDGKTEWEREYIATVAYGMNDISNLEMENLYKNLERADVSCETCTNNEMLQKFALFNSVSFNNDPCDKRCQQLHTCAIAELQEEEYLECVSGAISININRLWTFVTTALMVIVAYK